MPYPAAALLKMTPASVGLAPSSRATAAEAISTVSPANPRTPGAASAVPVKASSQSPLVVHEPVDTPWVSAFHWASDENVTVAVAI